MSDANKALAEVRGWLCGNLGSGDAGKVCGMLSVVSRRINELEAENDKLRAERDYLLMNSNPTATELRRVRRAWKKDRDENAKLRELVREVWRSCPVSEDDCAKCPHHIEESDEVWCDIPILMGELGVLGE